MKVLITLLNVGFVMMIMLMVMLKYEITVISLENIEGLHRETVITKLHEIIKFLLYSTVLWLTSHYARNRQIRL